MRGCGRRGAAGGLQQGWGAPSAVSPLLWSASRRAFCSELLKAAAGVAPGRGTVLSPCDNTSIYTRTRVCPPSFPDAHTRRLRQDQVPWRSGDPFPSRARTGLGAAVPQRNQAAAATPPGGRGTPHPPPLSTGGCQPLLLQAVQGNGPAPAGRAGAVAGSEPPCCADNESRRLAAPHCSPVDPVGRGAGLRRGCCGHACTRLRASVSRPRVHTEGGLRGHMVPELLGWLPKGLHRQIPPPAQEVRGL